MLGDTERLKSKCKPWGDSKKSVGSSCRRGKKRKNWRVTKKVSDFEKKIRMKKNTKCTL